MRGKPAGQELEKVRGTSCTMNGLKLSADGMTTDENVGLLHELYQSDPDQFVKDSVREIAKLNLDLLVDENPADAIRLCLVSAFLVDRMTSRELMNCDNPEARRTGSGIMVYNGTEQETLPYEGKRGEQ
jgi:hypothetical protein